MKKFVFVAGLVLFSVAGFSQPKKLKDMIGRWEIAGEQGAILEIVDSATISLTYQGETRQITNVKTDFTKSPYWFDFSTKDSSSVVHVKSLVEIIGDNMLKWQLFIDEDRAPYFTASKGEILYLKKTAAAAITATTVTTATAKSN
jgi:hypothetical protein